MTEKPMHSGPPMSLTGEKSITGGNHPIFRRWRPLKFIIVAAVVLIALLVVASGWMQKELWMRQLGYTRVFWTLLSLQWELFCAAFVVAFLYLGINLRFARGNGATFHSGSGTGESAVAEKIDIRISPSNLKLAITALAAVAALIFAAIFHAQWDTYLRFRYGGPFGLSDPLFGADVGFYLFRLLL